MNITIIQCNACRDGELDQRNTRCTTVIESDVSAEVIQSECKGYKCVADGTDDAEWKIVEVDE